MSRATIEITCRDEAQLSAIVGILNALSDVWVEDSYLHAELKE